VSFGGVVLLGATKAHASSAELWGALAALSGLVLTVYGLMHWHGSYVPTFDRKSGVP